MSKIKVTNPANCEIVATYNKMSFDESSSIIDKAHVAFKDWKTKSIQERATIMHKAADLLRERKDEHAKLMTKEMGKLYVGAVGEVEKCADMIDYYADHAAEFLKDVTKDIGKKKSIITFQPIGVVLGIMPWNYPFWQVLRYSVPTMMAGNVTVFKHAQSVTGCALAIEKLLHDAGVPKDAYRALLTGSEEANKLIEHDKVRAVTLTGSVPAGRAVAETAGKALKKTVLELGGSDPYIVLKDADIDLAVEETVKGRLSNAGQSCIAAKRMIVVSDVYDEFVTKYKEAMKEMTLGDPMDRDTKLGPMSSVDLRDDLHKQVQESIENGALCILGGGVPDEDGAWYPATLLTNVTPGMPAYDDELFGPVASIIKASDEADAIRIANDSQFGLGGGIFTSDEKRGFEIARNEIDTGMMTVNGYGMSAKEMPFGGVKNSGYGRELSEFGMHEFVNIKAVVII